MSFQGVGVPCQDVRAPFQGVLPFQGIRVPFQAVGVPCQDVGFPLRVIECPLIL